VIRVPIQKELMRDSYPSDIKQEQFGSIQDLFCTSIWFIWFFLVPFCMYWNSGTLKTPSAEFSRPPIW